LEDDPELIKFEEERKKLADLIKNDYNSENREEKIKEIKLPNIKIGVGNYDASYEYSPNRG
jgi:hypothetical protein